MKVIDDSNLLPFTGRVLRKTMDAILFDDDEASNRDGVWLPLSSIHMDKATRLRGGYPVHTVEVPEWLAFEKGMI
jgi:hypothetical protein